jgi:hypothetical protein
MAASPRLNRWMAQWIVGMPTETHLSIMSLILGGGFDRLPRALHICFAHGGGSFAFWLGRLENAWHRRHDLLGTSEHPPSHYRSGSSTSRCRSMMRWMAASASAAVTGGGVATPSDEI